MTNFSYEVFSEVANRKTFVATAKKLNITPSAVSHSISGFEKDLGFALFVRKRTGVKLTPNGRKILPIVQEILNAEAKLNEEAAKINGISQGKVRIGAFSSVCINWLPDIINTFKKQFPKIEIILVQGNFNDVINQVDDGNLDIGFSALPIKERLQTKKLYKDRIYCVTPKEFKPKNGKSITREDIENEVFILQQIDYDGITKKALDSYDVSVNSIQYSIDDASIIAMVESGLGLGILPELALQKLSGNVNYYPFNHDFYRTIYLVSHEKAHQTPSTKAFIKTIEDYVEKRYGAG